MKRDIYEVYAKVVDANGNYNTLSGYPKVFDSRLYDNNTDKTRARAYAEYYETISAMYKRDDRQLQIAMIILANNGVVVQATNIGSIADLPDPEPEPEPESEGAE